MHTSHSVLLDQKGPPGSLAVVLAVGSGKRTAVALHALIPALRRQKQKGLCEFKTSLVYKVSSRTARAVTQGNPVFKGKNQKVH